MELQDCWSAAVMEMEMEMLMRTGIQGRPGPGFRTSSPGRRFGFGNPPRDSKLKAYKEG